jgi:prefoldin alpha subunit
MDTKKLSPEEADKQLNEKSIEFEMLRQQLAGVDGELQQLHNRLGAFDRAKQTLEGLKTAKEGDDLLIPLGEGLFVKADLKNIKEVLVGVGSNVVLGKELSKGVEYVQARIDEADNLISRLNSNAQLIMDRMRVLEKDLMDLTEAKKSFAKKQELKIRRKKKKK